MNEKLKYNSLLQEIKEIYLSLTEGEPSPDDEIEARENFIRLFKSLKPITSIPKLDILIDECLDKLVKWDVLELWFVEVPGLKKLIKQILEQAGIELLAQKEVITPSQEKVSSGTFKKEHDVDVEEVVEKITEQFKSQINDLKKEIERLQQELKKEKVETPSELIRRELKEELKELKIMKKRGESSPIKKPKLPPPEIKLPKLKIAKKLPKISSEEGKTEDLFSKRLKEIQDIATPFKLAISEEKEVPQEDASASEEEIQKLQQPSISLEKEQVFTEDDSEIQEPIEKMAPASEEVEKAPEEIIPEVLKTPEKIDTKTQDLWNLEETLKKLEELENLDTLESEKEVAPPEITPINEMVQEPSEDFAFQELNESKDEEVPDSLPEPSFIPPPPPKALIPPKKLTPIPKTPFKEIESVKDLSMVPKKPSITSISVETPPSVKKPKISLEIKEEPIESKISKPTPFVEQNVSKEKKISIIPEIIEESIEDSQPEKPPFIPDKEMEIKTEEEPMKKEEPLPQPFNLIGLGEKLESKTAEKSNSIKNTKIDLFEALTSVGKKQIKKSEKDTEFVKLLGQKKLVKEDSKSVQITASPSFFKGTSTMKKETSEDEIIPINIEELPRDKNKLYQELIVHEGKRYKLEKLYKELEDKHGRGVIDDLEFRNQTSQLKKKLNLITEIINGIRQVISTL
ncbi:MAG: hypothetical protein ACTSXH_00160 [Promethearchaeota archaeon]